MDYPKFIALNQKEESMEMSCNSLKILTFAMYIRGKRIFSFCQTHFFRNEGALEAIMIHPVFHSHEIMLLN